MNLPQFERGHVSSQEGKNWEGPSQKVLERLPSSSHQNPVVKKMSKIIQTLVKKSPKKHIKENQTNKKSRCSKKTNQIPKIFPRKPTNKNLTENSTYRGSGNRCFTVKFRRPCGLNVAKKNGKFSLDVWLVGGWTNPSEKYARQIGSFSPRFGVKIKNLWVATTGHVELFEPLEVQPTKQSGWSWRDDSCKGFPFLLMGKPFGLWTSWVRGNKTPY